MIVFDISDISSTYVHHLDGGLSGFAFERRIGRSAEVEDGDWKQVRGLARSVESTGSACEEGDGEADANCSFETRAP